MCSRMCKLSLIFCALLLFLTGQVYCTDTGRTQLHLLALVPQGNEDSLKPPSCVDRGEELLPAAHIAAEIANTNIFKDEYQLEIIRVKTSTCTDDSFSLTLAEFVQSLTNKSLTVIGVIGMMCSSTVLSVSPLASHTGVNLLQITSGSISPISIAEARTRVSVENLYQTAPPLTDFNKVVIDFLRTNSVSELAVIRHIGTFVIEHDIIASDLRTRVKNEAIEVNITDFEIEFDTTQVPIILDSIRRSDSGIRVIYASVTVDEARKLLCTAIKSTVQVVHPRNQWIFHSHSFSDLTQATKDCTQSEMERALEGALLLQYPGRRDEHNTDLLSFTNLTYSDYFKRYRQELSNDTVCDESPGIVHANALYDSVISFAIAANRSLSGLRNEVMNHGIGNSTSLTELLKSELDSVSFLGASGTVEFDNETHESSNNNSVVVLRVFNETKQLAQLGFIPGFYNSTTQRIKIAFPIVTIALVAILVIVHTLTLIVFIYHWNHPDIKATSPVLSLVIFVACYMLDLSLLMTALQYSYSLGVMYEVFCSVENWLLFIGILLIFATLLMRLLRVYRIFFHYSKPGKKWNDYGVLLFVLAFVLVGVVILLLWMVVDTPVIAMRRKFISDTDQPFFSVILSCRSKYFETFPIWIILLLAYTGVMMVIVMLLAIRTRKVRIESFKDTRTVNIFIYITTVTFMFSLILSLLFEAVQNQEIVFIFRVLAIGSVSIASACFLFLPKIYTAFCEKRNPRRKSTTDGSVVIPNNKNIATTVL